MPSDSETARYRARHAVEAAINALVRDAEGDAGFVQAQIFPGARTIVTKALPVPALTAAVKVRDIATGQIRRAATDARGAGATWGDIAHVLGLTDDGYRFAAEQAYDHARGPEPSAAEVEVEPFAVSRWRDSRVCWTCDSCGGRVTDHGPYDSHPDAREAGHTPACSRHQAAVTAFEEDW